MQSCRCRRRCRTCKQIGLAETGKLSAMIMQSVKRNVKAEIEGNSAPKGMAVTIAFRGRHPAGVTGRRTPSVRFRLRAASVDAIPAWDSIAGGICVCFRHLQGAGEAAKPQVVVYAAGNRLQGVSGRRRSTASAPSVLSASRRSFCPKARTMSSPN